MKKTIILLSGILLVTAGCNTQQEIMDTVRSAITNSTEILKTPNKEQKQQLQSYGKDIEDKYCAKIPYKRHTICKVQVHLNNLGYNAGSADGSMGRKTEKAIKRFQSEFNIKPTDGKPSPELLAKLREKSSSKNINTKKNMAISAVGCGAASILLGKGKSTTGKVAVGCGVIAGIASEVAKNENEKYAKEYYKIKDENEKNENEINQIAKQTQANKNKAKSYKSKIETLIKNEKNDKLFISKAGNLRIQLDKQARNNKRERSNALAKKALLDKQINDVTQLLVNKPKEEEYKKILFALKAKKATLIKAIDQSNEINSELIAQKNILDNAIIERS